MQCTNNNVEHWLEVFSHNGQNADYDYDYYQHKKCLCPLLGDEKMLCPHIHPGVKFRGTE